MAVIKPIRGALAAACAMAGVSALPAQAVEVEAAAMLYRETDRVTAVEPVLSLSQVLSGGRSLGLKISRDTLSGASPNGAVPSRNPQTYTRPSGLGGYVIPAGGLPLDDSFKDSRTDLALTLEQRFGLLTRTSLGLHGSTEHDYRSMGGSLILKREFDRRNRTLSAGFSYSADSIEPEGGLPIPFAAMAAVGESQARSGSSESKTLVDFLLGFTQIIDRHTVAQLNYSASSSEGYLTDPYKLLSVVQAEGGAEPGEPVEQLHEGRPDSRLKQSVYGRVKRHLNRDILDVSYRYLWDDWGLSSHTTEFRYHWRFREGRALVPHLRWYRQGAADLYRHSLVEGDALPAHASADPRLAAFDAWTLGLKYRHQLPGDRELSLRAEYYFHRGDDHPADAIGQLRDQDLFPDLDAIIVQIGCRFDLF